jgi:hypothetical protein
MRVPLGIVAVILSVALGCAAQPGAGDGVDARVIELGTSTAELIALLGAPMKTRDLAAGTRTFRTFYYPNSLNCVVDLTADAVCKVSIGETDGYCYPCASGAGAGHCP